MRRMAVVALSALLVLAMAPGAVAKSAGTDRPIKTYLTGVVNFEFVGVRGEDPCPVIAVSDGYGTMSHLGLVRVHWEHCSPVTLPVYTSEHVTFTAANGDTLTGTYDLNGAGPYPLDIAGGTGRFAGATGHLTFTFDAWGDWANGFPVNPWHAWWQIDGVISY